MNTANQTPLPLRLQAAELEVKRIVKEGYLRGKPFKRILSEVDALLGALLPQITILELKADAAASLRALAKRQYRELTRQIPFPALLTAAAVFTGAAKGNRFRAERILREKLPQFVTYATDAKGVPLDIYSRDYMKRVRKALDKIADMRALDPEDERGRAGLRAKAELLVRYEAHREQIAGFKARGVRLVVCSVHADCSDRCAPLQGKTYSLDGTFGAAEDGRQFVPLERATDIYYTTKKGRTYKNGLFGFGCRHELYEYRPGMAIPTVSREEQQRQRRITERQRTLERRVLRLRERADMYRDVLPKDYETARRALKQAFDTYKRYCQANNRAFYPDRTMLI